MFLLKTKGSTTMKDYILKNLILMVILTSLLFSGCASAQNNTQTEDIRSVGQKITDYTLPVGYREQFAVDLLGYQLVSLEGSTPNCHIYIVQAPKETKTNIEKLKEQALQLEGDRKSEDVRDIRVVEIHTVNLRGQTVDMLVGEGVNSEKQPYREVTALFEGRGGPALINISAPESLWDWDQVHQFLSSLQ
jgi:osmotically-inducible protein OsmY